MRRRTLVAALALAALVAIAGVAYAANVYTLDRASTTPGGAGSARAPVPKKVLFSFSTNTDDGTRAKPIEGYDIGFQGLRYFGARMAKCSFAKASQTDLAQVKKDCAKAAAGSGTANNFFGPSNNPSAKTQCKLALRLYNTGHGLAIRLDRANPADCAIDPHTAIDARFRNVSISAALPSVSLRFKVGENLKHPIPGFDNSVNNVTSTVLRKTARLRVAGKTRRVGLLSSIGCSKGKRRIKVKFTDESGASKSVSKRVKG